MRANSGNEQFDLGGNGSAAVEGKAAAMHIEQFLSKKTTQTDWMQQRESDYMAQTQFYYLSICCSNVIKPKLGCCVPAENPALPLRPVNNSNNDKLMQYSI